MAGHILFRLWNLSSIDGESIQDQRKRNILWGLCPIYSYAHATREGGILAMPSQRRYFRILALLLAVPFLVTGVQAAHPQGGGGGGPRGEGGRRGPMSPDDRLKQLTKDFDLTADQQTKIKPILVDSQKKMDDLRNDSTGDRQAMRDKMMKIMQDTNTQVRALLDDKQKEQFDKQEQDRMKRMQNRRGGGMGGPGGYNPGGPPPQN
jgi:protein CpxP